MRRPKNPEGSETASAGGDGRFVSGVIDPPCYRVPDRLRMSRSNELRTTLLCARFYIVCPARVQKTGSPMARLDFNQIGLDSFALFHCSRATGLETTSLVCRATRVRVTTRRRLFRTLSLLLMWLGIRDGREQSLRVGMQRPLVDFSCGRK